MSKEFLRSRNCEFNFYCSCGFMAIYLIILIWLLIKNRNKFNPMNKCVFVLWFLTFSLEIISTAVSFWDVSALVSDSADSVDDCYVSPLSLTFIS